MSYIIVDMNKWRVIMGNKLEIFRQRETSAVVYPYHTRMSTDRYPCYGWFFSFD